jgi:hypothetical protein
MLNDPSLSSRNKEEMVPMGKNHKKNNKKQKNKKNVKTAPLEDDFFPPQAQNELITPHHLLDQELSQLNPQGTKEEKKKGRKKKRAHP